MYFQNWTYKQFLKIRYGSNPINIFKYSVKGFEEYRTKVQPLTLCKLCDTNNECFRTLDLKWELYLDVHILQTSQLAKFCSCEKKKIIKINKNKSFSHLPQFLYRDCRKSNTTARQACGLFIWIVLIQY